MTLSCDEKYSRSAATRAEFKVEVMSLTTSYKAVADNTVSMLHTRAVIGYYVRKGLYSRKDAKEKWKAFLYLIRLCLPYYMIQLVSLNRAVCGNKRWAFPLQTLS